MPRSSATTVAKYLASLPPERRKVVAAVRQTVVKHMPKGYRETMGWGMICYGIPLEEYPETHNGRPLCYAALAAQKNHFALYLMGAYVDARQVAALEKAFARAGKRMDMGKSCLRFKRLEDLPLPAIAKVIASTPPRKFIAFYEAARAKP